jgi:hypothetical protein
MLSYELLWVTRTVCRTVNHYNPTSILVFHGTVWCQRVPGLMNRIHAYSYFWQTLLPSISYSIWSPGLSCEVPDISHLDCLWRLWRTLSIGKNGRKKKKSWNKPWSPLSAWRESKWSKRQQTQLCHRIVEVMVNRLSLTLLRKSVLWYFLVKTDFLLSCCYVTTLSNVNKALTSIKPLHYFCWLAFQWFTCSVVRISAFVA